MLFALLTIAPSFKIVPFVLDGMVEAQAKVGSERILATSKVVAENATVDFEYIIDVERNREAQVVLKPNPFRKIEEIYYYKQDGGKQIAYAFQPATSQFTQSDGEEPAFGGFIKAATPNIDDFIVSLIVPTGLKQLNARVDSNSPIWKYEKNKEGVVLTYILTKSSIKFVLNPQTLRVQKAAFANEAGGIIWTLKYQPFRKITPPPQVKGSYKVAQFDNQLGKGNTSSPAANPVLQRAFEFYDEPKSLAYTVNTDGEETTVYYSREYVYQSDQFAEWYFDGSKLTLTQKSDKRIYSGSATRQDILKAVASTGSRVEPNLRNLIRGRNPIRLLLNDNSSIDIGKSTTVNGEKVDVLDAILQFADIKVYVATKDGFVVRIETTPVGTDGKKYAKTTSNFRRLSGGNFKLNPPRNNIKPLSELLK